MSMLGTSENMLQQALLGFCGQIDELKAIIKKFKEAERIDKEIIAEQEKIIEDLRKGIPNSPSEDQKSSTSSEVESPELIENQKYIDQIHEQLTLYQESIKSNHMLIYKAESVHPNFPIEELLGKLIGKKGVKISKYEQIVKSKISCLKKKKFIEFSHILDNEVGEIFLIINVNIGPDISMETFSQLRQEMREEMIEVINTAYTNDFPNITISSIFKNKEEIHQLLNTTENISMFKEILKKESFEDNISELQFSVTELGTKLPTYDILLSIQVKMFIYKDYQRKEKGKDAHALIRVEKENNLIKRLEEHLQKIVNS